MLVEDGSWKNLETGASHAEDLQALFEACATTEEGLTEKEAERRRQLIGPNSLPLAAPTPWWKRFLLQFHSVRCGRSSR